MTRHFLTVFADSRFPLRSQSAGGEQIVERPQQLEAREVDVLNDEELTLPVPNRNGYAETCGAKTGSLP
jgi:hypothetical protein